MLRYYKQSIGLGFKTPKEAITGNYGAYLPTHAQHAGLLESPPPARPHSSTQHGSFVACPADRRCLLLLSAVDKKCPFTSNVSIRGRVMTGVVKSTKMNRTVTVRRDYLHYINKYNRFEKRHKMTAAHLSPCFIGLKEGDTVTIGQCRCEHAHSLFPPIGFALI